MNNKQVDLEHYSFKKYITKKRWSSIWHQLDEIISLQPKNVLEIGPGPGTLKQIASIFGIDVKTLDMDSDLDPDFISSASQIPISSCSFDVVCAFQVLEHMQIDQSLTAFSEMSRVAKKAVIISLPDAKTAWPFSITIPKLGPIRFYITNPLFRPSVHYFDGQHYWEINKKGFELPEITERLLAEAPDYRLSKTYRVPENVYHRFLIFERVK